MNIINKEKGFTLVEILVAFAVLMIMLFVFNTLFTFSFSGIFRAGRKSEALFEAQQKVDNSISAGPSSEDDVTWITFDGIEEPIPVKGEIMSEDYEYEGNTGTMHYFFPSGN